MDVAELCDWLEEHGEDLFAFTAFEVGIGSEQDAISVLGQWLHYPDWNQPRYRFLPIGQDAAGGMVAIWLRRSREMPAPVAFFAVGGGAGVIAPSPLAFAQALASSPSFEDCEGRDRSSPAYLLPSEEGSFSAERTYQTTAPDAAARYREALEERFGPTPPFPTLVAVHPIIQAEFRGWVTAVQARAAERRGREERERAEEKRRAARAKAERYAAVVALPASAADVRDAAEYQGTCAACGAEGKQRLTRFEELAFGICYACYFSNAW